MAKLSSEGVKAVVSPKAAPKAALNSAVYDEFAQASSDYGLSEAIITLYGNRGVGKTFMAASASKYWSQSGARELKDMLWISTDAAATAGFASQGIRVPEVRLIDLIRDAKKWKAAGFQKSPSITEAASWTVGYAAERVAKGQTEWVVVDTLSTLDEEAILHHKKRCGVSAAARLASNASQGERTNFFLPYDMNLEFHSKFRLALRMSGAKVLLLCHTREARPTELARFAFNVAGGVLVPALTGNAPEIYIRNVSLELYIQKRVDPKGEVKRVAWTTSRSAETKNRWADLLDEQEPADMGVILSKIRKGIGHANKQ